MGLTPVHRGPPQNTPEALPPGLGQDGEVLGHELGAADRVGAYFHRADRAHDATIHGGSEDRAAPTGLHLPVKEGQAIGGHGRGERGKGLLHSGGQSVTGRTGPPGSGQGRAVKS